MQIYDYVVKIKGYRNVIVRAGNAQNARASAEKIVRKEFNDRVKLTTSNSTVERY